MQRTNSGSRTGVSAMVHTLKSMEDLSLKKRSKEEFKKSFIDEFKKDYPDATTTEINTAFANNIDWGKGKQLGRTPTELMKRDNLPDAIKGFEERQANIAKSKIMPTSPTAAPAIPAPPPSPKATPAIPAPPAPAKTAPAKAPVKTAPKTAPVKTAPVKTAPKAAPKAAPAAPQVAAVIPRTQAQKDKDEGPTEEGQFKKITRNNVGEINDNVKVHIKSNVSPTVTASAIAKQMQIINQRRFKIGHANIIYHRLSGIAKKATYFL